MTTDETIPPAVAALIELGRPEYERAKAAAEKVQLAILNGVYQAAERRLLAEPGFTPAMFEYLHPDNLFATDGRASLRLELPGCDTICLSFTHTAEGWKADDMLRVRAGRGGAPVLIPTLAVAAAVAAGRRAKATRGRSGQPPMPPGPRPTEAEWREIARQHYHEQEARRTRAAEVAPMVDGGQILDSLAAGVNPFTGGPVTFTRAQAERIMDAELGLSTGPDADPTVPE